MKTQEEQVSKFLQEWDGDGFTVQDVYIEKDCADLMAEGIVKLLNNVERINNEKMSNREKALEILLDNMSNATAKYIAGMRHLEEWIVDAMLEYHKKQSEDVVLGSVIHIPIEPHFAGDYRLEYDGKYITLFGKDNRYEGFRFTDDQDAWYEEMVLISCALEIRKATPTIKEVTDKFITVDLGCV